MTTILDPTDERVPVERAISQRPAALSGAIALLDIAKATWQRTHRPLRKFAK